MTKHAVLEPSAPVHHEVAGGSIAVRLRGEQTGGAIGAVEMTIPAGFAGLPSHVHPDFDEVFFVLDGELSFRVGDEVLAAPPGAVIYVPGDVPHTFAELHQRPAHVLLVFNPAGHERYFEALAAALRDGEPTPELFSALMAEYGITPV